MSVCVFPILNAPPISLPIPSLWVIPLHQPQASCIMYQTWTGDSFDMWYFTCFNAILPYHPTLTLSWSPKDCSIHLCLFCCLTYRVQPLFLKIFFLSSLLTLPFCVYVGMLYGTRKSFRLFFFFIPFTFCFSECNLNCPIFRLTDSSFYVLRSAIELLLSSIRGAVVLFSTILYVLFNYCTSTALEFLFDSFL